MNMIELPSPAPVCHRISPRKSFHGLSLEQLYERRQALDRLIQSLEVYQETKRRPAGLLPFVNAARKCS